MALCLIGALCLVVRGRHVGGVISWGRHDRYPNSQEGLVLQRNDNNLSGSGSNKNGTLKHAKSAYLKTFLFR